MLIKVCLHIRTPLEPVFTTNKRSLEYNIGNIEKKEDNKRRIIVKLNKCVDGTVTNLRGALERPWDPLREERVHGPWDPPIGEGVQGPL